MFCEVRAVSRRVAEAGVISALCFVLSYIEFLLPISFGLPGIKLGLANICIVYALLRRGTGMAAFVSAVRVLLSWLMFGSFMSFIYSAAGAALSLAVMSLMKRSRHFSAVGISSAGGFMHNTAQVAAAITLTGTPSVWRYLPPLWLAGTLFGALNGLLAGEIIRRSVRPHEDERRTENDKTGT